MQRFAVVTLAILCAGSSWAQSTPETSPQTARQALIEMFFSKTPGTLMKHLPDITRAALEKSGSTKGFEQYSLMAGQMQAQKNLQTFETGSILLSTEDSKENTKFEVTVVNDSLQGDNDDIEVSFQTYKNGELQRAPYMPHVTFSMKTESGLWKLNEVSLTVHVPLADPDLLKSITDGIKARAAASASQTAALQNESQTHAPTVTFGNDAQILTAMRTILTAEVTYAATYRGVGYTCTLSDLDGFGGGERNEHQAMLINSGLAGGKKYGYIFSLSECGTFPAKSFVLTAAPNAANFGKKTFCTDQTAVIKSSPDTNPAACMSNGTPVQ